VDELEVLLFAAGARWRAAQPELRPVAVLYPQPGTALQSWAHRHRRRLVVAVVTLSAILSFGAIGAYRLTTDRSAGADADRTVACVAVDLGRAASAIVPTDLEGFRAPDLDRARQEGVLLTNVAERSIGRLALAGDGELVRSVREVAELYAREAKTLTSVGVGTPGVDPQTANAARAAVRRAADDLRSSGGAEGATPGCELTAIPAPLGQEAPTAPPPATAMPIPTDAVMAAVRWDNLPTPQVLRDMALVTAEFGWVKTDIDLRLTDDGGRTWRLSMPPDLQADPVSDAVVFGDPSHGWLLGVTASGSSLAAYRTTDGGRHWAAIPPPWTEVSVMSPPPVLRLVGGALVAVVSGGTEYASLDGGSTWSKGLPADDASRFVQVDVRYRAGSPRDEIEAVVRIPSSSDVVTILPEPAPYRGTERWAFPVAGRMFDARNGIIVVTWSGASGGTTAAVYRTDDGGRSWSITADAQSDARSATIFDGTTWAIVGDADGRGDNSMLEVWATSDGGRTWQRAATSYKGSVQVSGSWTDTQHAWVIVNLPGSDPGESDVIMSTSDGGQTWQVITPPK
jgi:photosystem II stability/assembly factor-like uncharacterized protein